LILKMKQQLRDLQAGTISSQKLAQSITEIESALLTGIEPWFQHIDGLLVGE